MPEKGGGWKLSQNSKVNAVDLLDALHALGHWRDVLELAGGLEMPTASLLLTIAIAPNRSLSCSLHSLTGITGLSGCNSLRLNKHLSALRWLTSAPCSAGHVELQLTDKGFEVAMNLADTSLGATRPRD